MTLLTGPRPSAPSTLRLTIVRSAARCRESRQRHDFVRRRRPFHRDAARRRRRLAVDGTSAIVSSPAMIPATCVPCPNSSTSGAPGGPGGDGEVARGASGASSISVLCFRKCGWSPCTPESSTAHTMRLPLGRERRERGIGLDRAHGMREQRLHLEVGPDVEDHPRGGVRRAARPPPRVEPNERAECARPSSRAKTYWSLSSVLRWSTPMPALATPPLGARRQRHGDQIGARARERGRVRPCSSC